MGKAILFILLVLGLLMGLEKTLPAWDGQMGRAARKFILEVGAVGLAVKICLKAERRDFSAIGLELHKDALAKTGPGAIFGFCLAWGVVIVSVAPGRVSSPLKMAWDGAYMVYALVSVARVAIREEIAFRGYLFHALGQNRLAGLASCALFGLMHLGGPLPWRAVAPVVFGLIGDLFLAGARRWGLWWPIGAHFAYNMCLGYVLGVCQTHGLLELDLSGPAWWIGAPGTIYGPSIGAAGVIVIIVGIFIVRETWEHQKRRTNERQL